MAAYVYYISENGSVGCEHMDFYPDLRYCKKQLEGDERILEGLSFYKQDKICLCQLLGVQKHLLGEKIIALADIKSAWWESDTDFQQIAKNLTQEK
jgi:hypothetical protein